MKRILTLLLIDLLSFTSYAQEEKVLPFDEFMEMVYENHPVALQARLAPIEADALLRAARGGFDPKLGADLSQKDFDEKEYYRLIDAGLKLPTWYGLEFSAGYEQNQGQFLNPEDNTPDNGLIHAGVSVPLGQGLFIDKRRAELRKAEIYQNLNELEQTLLLNDILVEGGIAYWFWFEEYLDLLVFEEALTVAQIRFDAVKESARLGDNPPIDTLEAGIQLQNRILSLQQAQLDLANASALVSSYLWADGLVPLELGLNTIPQAVDATSVTTPPVDMRLELDAFMQQHPQLLGYGFKLDQLDIERRWMAEQLKPTLDLKYNALSQRVGSTETTGFNTENFTWGVDFELPLFLRKERGRLRLAELRIQETEFVRSEKQQMLFAKAQQSINDWETTEQQYRLYTRTVSDYAGLLAGERQLFDSGESSLFLVNRRELGYIQAQIKLNELLTKNKISELKTDYMLGTLSNRYLDSQ